MVLTTSGRLSCDDPNIGSFNAARLNEARLRLQKGGLTGDMNRKYADLPCHLRLEILDLGTILVLSNLQVLDLIFPRCVVLKLLEL